MVLSISKKDRASYESAAIVVAVTLTILTLYSAGLGISIQYANAQQSPAIIYSPNNNDNNAFYIPVQSLIGNVSIPVNVDVTAIVPINIAIQNAQICAQIGGGSCTQAVLNPTESTFAPTTIDLSQPTPTVSTTPTTTSTQPSTTTGTTGMTTSGTTTPNPTTSPSTSTTTSPPSTTTSPPSTTTQQPSTSNGGTSSGGSSSGSGGSGSTGK